MRNSSFKNILKLGLIFLVCEYNLCDAFQSTDRGAPLQQNDVLKLISRSFKASEDPWMNPKQGVLASAKTKIYEVTKDRNGNVTFHEIENLINYITKYSPKLLAARIVNPKPRKSKSLKESKPTKNNGQKKKLSSTKSRPDVVYPEIAIAVTYDYFEKFDFDMWTVIPYLLSFWNAVDMRYRNFENPSYRFYISQILLEIIPNTFEFLTVHEDNHDYLKTSTITKLRTYWYEKNESIPLDSYDMMVVMSSREICRKIEENNCSPKILGQAWASGACRVNHDEKAIDKVAIVYDNAAFEGISIAAHEIGHLLGAYDDGAQFYNATTHDYGPPNCDLWAGYTMAGVQSATYKRFEWSDCSIKKFDNFIESDDAKCLYNKPDGYNQPVGRYLPGKIMDADEQCRRAGAIESCESEVSNCISLQCLYKDEGCQNSTFPAVEGTPCGFNYVGHICLHGDCVYESDSYN